MRIPFKFLSVVACAVLVVPMLTACGGGDKSTGGLTSTPSTPPADDDDDGGDDDGGDTTIDSFKISVVPQTDTPVTTYLHAFDDFDAACEIDADETTPTDLKCLLNVKESDLFLSDLTLKLQVPPTMCKYVTEYPYWYWNKMAGTGPAILAGTLTDGVITGCSADGVAGTVNAAGDRCEVTEGYFTKVGFFCGYNYSLDDDTLPNCCTGSYTQTLTTVTSGTGTDVTTTGKYVGKAGNCAAGPAVNGMDWPTSSTTGLPQQQIAYVPQTTGYSKTTTIPAGIDINSSAYTNVYSANMYAWTDYVAGTHDTATKPKGLQTLVDLGGSTLSSYVPNSAYTYGCWNNAGELKHRIRVYINEWDTDENFTAYAAGSGDTTKSPDALVTDVEGTDCQTTDTIGIGYCDDYWDWDQLTNEAVDYPEEFTDD